MIFQEEQAPMLKREISSEMGRIPSIASRVWNQPCSHGHPFPGLCHAPQSVDRFHAGFLSWSSLSGPAAGVVCNMT